MCIVSPLLRVSPPHVSHSHDIVRPDQRVFGVIVEDGAEIIVDMFNEAGAAYTAYLLYVDAVVSDGVLDIQFKCVPGKDEPKISGVAVYKVNDL
jgi:hypothetical protein